MTPVATIAGIDVKPITFVEVSALLPGLPPSVLGIPAFWYDAGAMIDTDGSGPLHGDPDAQADTTLHYKGFALNADLVPYIVLPPGVINAVKGIVLGCLAHVKNKLTGQWTLAVVADIGPRKKLGEISVACAKAIGINPSPTRGGEERHVIEYTFFPGVPAVVNGIEYQLKSAA